MAWTGYSEQGAGSQERGPGRFALQVPGVVEQRALPTPDGVRGGVRAGQVGGSLHVGQDRVDIGPVPAAPKVAPDPTFMALMKIGGQFFADKVKDLEQQKYVEGMSKAASGQALLDIVNERPAWARLFGDGGAAEGARAYSAEAAVSEWASSVQTAMPELRRTAPEHVPKALMRMADSLMTGDQEADAMIRSSMLKQVPALVKAHTREHVAWLHEEAVANQAKAFSAAGRVADGTLRDPRATEDDKAAAVTNLLSTLSYTEGMNPKMWVDNLGGFVKSAAQNNQFQMLQGLEDRGLLNAMPPEQGAQLKSYIREQAKRYRSDNPPQALVMEGNMVMAQMESGVIDASAGLARMADINARYKQASGNIVDLFDAAVVGGSLQSSAKANYAWRRQESERLARERATAAEAGAKAQWEKARTDSLASVALTGQLQYVEGTETEKKDAIAAAWRAAPGKTNGYFALTENWRTGNLVSDVVQNELRKDYRASLSEDGVGPNFVLAYNRWREFNYVSDDKGNIVAPRAGADGAAAAYFGPEMDGAMRTFHELTMQGARVADPAISEMAFKATRAPRPPAPDKAQRKEIQSTLKDTLSAGGIMGFFQTEPKDSTLAQVAQYVEPLVGHYNRMDTANATKAAYHAAVANGLEVWGDAVMQRRVGQPALDRATGIPSAEVGNVLQATMDARAKDERFKEPTVLSWTRLPGEAVRLQSIVQDKDGGLHTVVLTGDDLKAFWNKSKDRPVSTASPLTAGPKITYTNPDGFPGIYASPEALKAWRDKQGK